MLFVSCLHASRFLMTVVLMVPPFLSNAQDPTQRFWMDGGNDTLQNLRAWRPAEPLDWARPGLLDSLLNEGFDNFSISVESPRQEGYFKLVRYISSNDKEALFVEGDLRFICYDMETRANASQSIVVGYSHGAHFYWYGDQLCFQNGASNWHRHANRHYHSLDNGQIEMRETSIGPRGIENSMVFSGDSSSHFIVFEGKLEESTQPALVYRLGHQRRDWEYLGALNPGIRRLFSYSQIFSLEDYWISTYSGTLTVIRKSDQYITQVPSTFALERKKATEVGQGLYAWRAVRGNSYTYSWAKGTVTEHIDSVLSDAQWVPLTVPHEIPEDDQGKASWPVRLFPLISLVLALALIGMNIRLRAASANAYPVIDVAREHHGAPSAELSMVIHHGGSNMSTQRLDEVLGLDSVLSDETKRSKRSRLIQLLNAESNAWFGAPVIHRSRSDSDKRVIVYRIASFDSKD